MTAVAKLPEKWRAEADSIHAPPYDDSENSNRAIAMHCCADELEAALSPAELGGVVYQCMCTDEDHIRNGPKDVWMDVNAESFTTLSQREDVRSRILYTTPRAAEAEWLPIESAPKDGSCCIVTNGVAVGEAWYSASEDGWWWANTHPTDAHDGFVYEPTNWRPLPAPPALTPPSAKGEL